MAKKVFGFCLVLMMVMLCTITAFASRASDIEFVEIGNPGNAADVTPKYGYQKRPFGAVDYTFQMGKFEITCNQYADFLNATAASNARGQYDPKMVASGQIVQNGTEGNFTYTVNAGYENRPIGNVNWVNAARYCNWLTTGDTENGVYIFESDGSFNWYTSVNDELKRGSTPAYWIPNSDEYYKAAYYDSETQTYFDFATGSNATPTAGDFTGTNSGNWRNGGVLVDSTYFFTEVGAFANTISPYGCFDLLGNVWEWNEDFEWGAWVDTNGDGIADHHNWGPMYHGGSYWGSTPLYCNTDYYSGYVAGSITDLKNFDMGIRIASNFVEIALPGDANGDGMVDVGDLGILAGNYGMTEGATWAQGDFNGDGAIDVGDLGILAGNYGAAAAASVPEPMTLCLLSLGGLALVRRNRK